MDRDAFTAVFRAHHGAVLTYGLRRVDADTAREVAAETFTVAWRRADAVPDDPLPWLLATARRVLANEVRRRGRAERLAGRLHEATLTGGDAAGGDGGPVRDHAQQVVGAAVLRAALDRLGERDREVLLLVAWEGLDHAGLATTLGCSVGAARVRLHRARRRLAGALETPPARAPHPPTTQPITDRGPR